MNQNVLAEVMDIEIMEVIEIIRMCPRQAMLHWEVVDASITHDLMLSLRRTVYVYVYVYVLQYSATRQATPLKSETTRPLNLIRLAPPLLLQADDY